MRIEIGKYNAGTRGAVHFFFEKDEQTDQLYYVQAGPKGERRLKLKAAVDQPFYQQALQAAQSMLEKLPAPQ